MGWDKMHSHGGGKAGLWRAIKADRARAELAKAKINERKFDDQEIFDYIEMWVQEDKFCNFSVVLEYAHTGMACNFIYNMGCINHKMCYDYAKPIEKEIERIAKQYDKLSNKTKQKHLKEAFKDTIVIECRDCNLNQCPSTDNYELYKEELDKACWECNSTNINVSKGI